MRTYLRSKCSICNRTKDDLVDTKSTKFPKCSITLGCSGVLKPIQYTERGDTIMDSAPSGTQNWFSRFKTVTEFSNDTLQSLPISYGDESEIFFAVKLSTPPIPNDKLKITFTSDYSEVRPFREYTFNYTTAVDKILGVENSQGKKVLRFTATEEVKVFKNGVLMTAGTGITQYQISDGINSVPQNCVILNQVYKGNNQFKVVVSTPSVKSEFVLMLDLNSTSKTSESCWNNAGTILYRGEIFYIFCTNFKNAVIPVGKKITISKLGILREATETEVGLSNSLCLLSGGPTGIDRVLTMAIYADTLSNSQNSITVQNVDGVRVMSVLENVVSSIFPPFTVGTFSTESLITKSQDTPITDMLEHNFIIGPNK